jgi:hypothetical protein
LPINTHRHREYAGGLTLPALQECLDDRGHPLDTLVVQTEAGNQVVGEFDRADRRDLAGSGAAVDEHVVIVTQHAAAHPLKEKLAFQLGIEARPVERGHQARIGAGVVTAPGRDDVDLTCPGVRQRELVRYVPECGFDITPFP